MDKQKNRLESIQESLETDRIAEALDAWLEAEGKAALAENERCAGLPQYQLNRRTEKRLARAVERRSPAWQARRRLRLRVMLIAALLAAVWIAPHVSAIRSLIGNYFLTVKEESVDFSEMYAADNRYSAITIPPNLPDGFSQTRIKQYTSYTEIRYSNRDGEEIRYSVYRESASVRLDSEEADETKRLKIGGLDGVCIEKDGRINLFWGECPPCQLQGPASLKQELLQMAESTVQQPESSGRK